MNDFVFQNTTKVYFGKDQPLSHLGEEIRKTLPSSESMLWDAIQLSR